MKPVCVIAEKPDALARISEALADNGTLRELESNGARLFEFSVNGKPHVGLSAAGHLFGLFPSDEGARRWSYPILEFGWEPLYGRKGSEWTKRYYDSLKSQIGRFSEFYVATDLDAEGSLIALNVLRFIFGTRDGRRMKFGALTVEEIREAYKNASDHLDISEAESAMARHEIDALFGINLSRALTRALLSSAKGYRVLSAGRVQSPALALLMERELKIRNFKPEPFCQLFLRLEIEGKAFVAVHEKGRMKKADAEHIFRDCEMEEALVAGVERRSFKQRAPHPFDTTALQTESYSAFRLSPSQTMGLTERLYNSGWISYPRSSSEKFGSLNYHGIVSALASIKPYKGFVEKLLEKLLKPHEGEKTDRAHTAIVATSEAPSLERLPENERKIFDLVARRTLAAFGEEAVREKSQAILDVKGHRFILSAIKTLKPGWTEIYRKYMKLEEATLPNLEKGDRVKIVRLELVEGETEPPARYSQSSIIKELERRKLGTPATRHDVLQTLYTRKYIFGRSIAVTPLGEAVFNALKNGAPEVLTESLTRRLEESLERIATNRIRRRKVLGEARARLLPILEEFKKNEMVIGSTLARSLNPVIGSCPNCEKGELVVIWPKGKKRFVGCTNYPKCRASAPLPQRGSLTAYRESCDICSWPMVEVKLGKGEVWQLCVNALCPGKASKKDKPEMKK